MANDISGFGLQVNLVASNTFPQGVVLTQFADDSDPLDEASIDIADKAMGLNGDLLTWSKAVPVPVVIAVVPGSLDDINLQILADANRVAAGKFSARDAMTMTVIYPDGSSQTLFGGKIISAMMGKSVSSAGRLKSKIYGFAFENKVGA